MTDLEKNPKPFWGKNYATVDVYTQHVINLGMWIRIWFVSSELLTDLFAKPTDKQPFLDLSSSHPYH